MNQPYFSIIIPCLNEEKYLPALLNNLNQQTYTNFETYVVDGSSEDRTPSIVKTYPATYPLTLLSTTRRSASFQRNLGAKKAHGKVLIFFDGDTQIPKNYLAKLHAAFEVKKPHIINTWIKPDSRLPGDQLIANGMNIVYEASRLVNKPTCCGAMIAVRKGVFEDVGGFDEQTKYGEDSQFLQAVVNQNYKYLILPQPQYVYSLRRFRSEGTLDAIRHYTHLTMSLFSEGYHAKNIDYPMGGHVFKPAKSSSPTLAVFKETYAQLKRSNAEQKKSLQKLFGRLFS